MSDRAKEFLVKWFEDWMISVGAVHELSLMYTAQQWRDTMGSFMV